MPGGRDHPYPDINKVTNKILAIKDNPNKCTTEDVLLYFAFIFLIRFSIKTLNINIPIQPARELIM